MFATDPRFEITKCRRKFKHCTERHAPKQDPKKIGRTTKEKIVGRDQGKNRPLVLPNRDLRPRPLPFANLQS